jgi:hypothetical protein
MRPKTDWAHPPNMPKDGRITIVNPNESLLDRRIAKEIPHVFYRKTGLRYTPWNWNSLNRMEIDVIITEAAQIVQERMKNLDYKSDRGDV